MSKVSQWHEKFKWLNTYGFVLFQWLNTNSWTVHVPVFRQIKQIGQPYQKEFRKKTKLTMVVSDNKVKLLLGFFEIWDENIYRT